MRGCTWLEKNGDMPIFSLKNIEEYKMVEPGNLWGGSSDSPVFSFIWIFLHAFGSPTCKERLHSIRYAAKYAIHFPRLYQKKFNTCYGGDVFPRRGQYFWNSCSARIFGPYRKKISLSSLLCNVLHQAWPRFLIRFFHAKSSLQSTHEIHFFPSLQKIQRLAAFRQCNL